MTYVLILMLYWNGQSQTSMTSVPGFKTAESCEVAGKAAQAAVGKTQELRYVCLKQPE